MRFRLVWWVAGLPAEAEVKLQLQQAGKERGFNDFDRNAAQQQLAAIQKRKLHREARSPSKLPLFTHHSMSVADGGKDMGVVPELR